MSELRGFKFVTTLILEFEELENDNERKYMTFYLNSKVETVINERDIDDIFESTYITMITNKQAFLENVPI